MPDDLISYFRKRVAKPIDWTLDNDYRIEIVTVSGNTVTAAVESYHQGELDSRRQRRYAGEAKIAVGPDDTRQVILDRIAHAVDADNIRLGMRDPRLLAILGHPPSDEADPPRKATSETAEMAPRDETGYATLEAKISRAAEPFDAELPFDPEATPRAVLAGFTPAIPLDEHDEKLLETATRTRTRKSDTWWIDLANRTDRPDLRAKILEAGLSACWSGIPKRLFDDTPRYFAHDADPACGCSLMLAMLAAALTADGAPQQAYAASKACMALNARDGYGLRYLHAALAVLNGDRKAGDLLLRLFEIPSVSSDAASVWSAALLRYAFPRADVAALHDRMMEAAELNLIAASMIVRGRHKGMGLFDIEMSPGTPEEAAFIAEAQSAAWTHLGTMARGVENIFDRFDVAHSDPAHARTSSR